MTRVVTHVARQPSSASVQADDGQAGHRGQRSMWPCRVMTGKAASQNF